MQFGTWSLCVESRRSPAPLCFSVPQGGVLTKCSSGTYSMGGYTECLPCPTGWLCRDGLAEPCGYGTTMTAMTTSVQDDESLTTSGSGVYGGTCASCPPGGRCAGGGVWEECPSGTFSPGGDASTVCRPCAPGTFSNHTGTAQCETCAAGEKRVGGSIGRRASLRAFRGSLPCCGSRGFTLVFTSWHGSANVGRHSLCLYDVGRALFHGWKDTYLSGPQSRVPIAKDIDAYD